MNPFIAECLLPSFVLSARRAASCCSTFVKNTCALALLAGGLIGQAVAQTYIAPFSEARWSAESGSFACSLTQTIPQFGKATFKAATASEEMLEIKGDKIHFEPDLIRVEAVPPAWRDQSSAKQLGQIKPTQKALRLSGQISADISASLAGGANVMLVGPEFVVGLDARAFEAALKSYNACKKALVPYTFTQVARSQLTYVPGDKELSPAVKSRLNAIGRYAKADQKVIGIVIDAHAGTQPTPEGATLISQEQAQRIATYLQAQGVGADRITTRWHGDKFPIATNNTAAGRAKNTRVIVRLETAVSRAAVQKRLAALKQTEQQAASGAVQHESEAQTYSSAKANSSAPNVSESVTSDPIKSASASSAQDASSANDSPPGVSSAPISPANLEQLVEEQAL